MNTPMPSSRSRRHPPQAHSGPIALHGHDCFLNCRHYGPNRPISFEEEFGMRPWFLKQRRHLHDSMPARGNNTALPAKPAENEYSGDPPPQTGFTTAIQNNNPSFRRLPQRLPGSRPEPRFPPAQGLNRAQIYHAAAQARQAAFVDDNDDNNNGHNSTAHGALPRTNGYRPEAFRPVPMPQVPTQNSGSANVANNFGAGPRAGGGYAPEPEVGIPVSTCTTPESQPQPQPQPQHQDQQNGNGDDGSGSEDEPYTFDQGVHNEAEFDFDVDDPSSWEYFDRMMDLA